MVGQSLQTIEQLQTAIQPLNELNTGLPINHISPFDFDERKLKIGQWVDVKDTIDNWVG